MLAELLPYHRRFDAQRELYRPSLREWVEHAEAQALSAEAYLAAQARRAETTFAWADWLAANRIDAVLEPTVPVVAPLRGDGYDHAFTDAALISLTHYWDWTGFPVAALPAGVGAGTRSPRRRLADRPARPRLRRARRRGRAARRAAAMSERLAGKRVIVTGGAQGIGRAFVLQLAAAGARVLACDVNEAGLRETCARAGAVAVTADVGSPEDTLALAEAARDAFGGADALVNNAAVADGIGRHSFDEIPDEEWERVLRVNLKGVWLCTKAFAPLLREAGAGSIVNIASDTAFSGSPGLAHYVASKAGVLGLTRALARELGPSGIRVNAIAPGFVATEAPDPPTDAATYDTSLTPLRRTAVPDDLFGALAFLISDDSAFVSGQTLLVNGGRVLH